MANEVKQRFVELSVNELSLVDFPANQEEFVVIKRLNMEDDMPDDEKDKITKAEGQPLPVENDAAQLDGTKVEVEKVALEVPKPENEAVEKAMQKVVELVETIVKSTEPAAPIAEDKVEGDVKKTTEDKTEDDGEKTEKAANGEDETVHLLQVLESAISKAKQFTPKREAILKQTIETLQKLMADIAPESNAPKNMLPSGASIGGAGLADVAKAMQDLTEAFKARFESVSKSNSELAQRLETIEKTKQPTTSLEGDGGTDKQKTEKSFWSGVL